MADMEQYPQEWRQYDPIQPRGTDWRGFFRKLWAPIAAIGAFLAKFGVVLLKFKFLFSMFVSAAFYVWLGGWWFGIGLVVLLFVHEMGHVAEAKRQGLPVSAPVFIPFMGALDLAEADAAQRLERGQARDRRGRSSAPPERWRSYLTGVLSTRAPCRRSRSSASS